MKTFVIIVKNQLTKIIAIKALKNAGLTDTAVHDLYIKACISDKKHAIIINDLKELELWNNVLRKYEPMNATESKIYNALRYCAQIGFKKRTAA